MGRKVSIEFDVKEGNVYLDGEAVLPTDRIVENLEDASDEELSRNLLEVLTEQLHLLDPDTIEEDEDDEDEEGGTIFDYQTPGEWVGPILRRKDRALRESLIEMFCNELSQAVQDEAPGADAHGAFTDYPDPYDHPVVKLGDEFEEFAEAVQCEDIRGDEFKKRLDIFGKAVKEFKEHVDAKVVDHPAVQATLAWYERVVQERKRFE